jgi:hypothetical protein
MAPYDAASNICQALPGGVLYIFGDCATIISGAAIPVVIIILGASLAHGPDHSLAGTDG